MRGRAAGTLESWAAVKNGHGQAGGMGRPFLQWSTLQNSAKTDAKSSAWK